MSLNKIIADAAEANEAGGVIDRHAAINAVVPQILADAEMTEMCVRGYASKLIVTNIRSRRREAASSDARQISIFGLEETYVVEGGEGQIKRTTALSRLEFAGLISIRQRQVNADLAHLAKLRAAAKETASIWDRNPDWTWGQVEAAYAKTQRLAA